MRRALIATAGTAVGLVLLLGYKAGSPAKPQKVSLNGGPAGTVAPGTTTTPGNTEPAERSYTGQLVDYLYGDIEVEITLTGKRISDVSVVRNDATDLRSQMIGSEAVPILEQEALSAQGVNFDVVSGATFTSDAFAQSLQSALDKAGR